MFCPVCEAEYETGVTHCAKDGAELVERASRERAEGDASDARFVPLHNLGSPAEADMVADLLRQNGIRAAAQSGGMDAFSPLLSSTSPGAIVLVDERDYERASELYHSFFGDDITPLTGLTDDEEAALEEEALKDGELDSE